MGYIMLVSFGVAAVSSPGVAIPCHGKVAQLVEHCGGIADVSFSEQRLTTPPSISCASHPNGPTSRMA
jgi:hypothetical protein